VLDNNLVDLIYSNALSLNHEVTNDDNLGEEELIYHLRKISKELEYLIDLPFVKFWAFISKNSQIVDFLDEVLQNIRKYNDTEKIQVDLNISFSDSRLSQSSELA
jgi:hypothetical protein